MAKVEERNAQKHSNCDAFATKEYQRSNWGRCSLPSDGTSNSSGKSTLKQENACFKEGNPS